MTNFNYILDHFRQIGGKPGDKFFIRFLVPKQTPNEVKVRRGLSNHKKMSTDVYDRTVEGIVTLGKTGDDDIFNQVMKDGLGLSKKFLDVLKDKNERQGYQVHLIPHAGGTKDRKEMEESGQFKVIFWEVDDEDKDVQLEARQELEAQLGKPFSLIVETRRGFHNYLRLAEPVDFATWQKLQQRLIQKFDADRIDSANHTMRMGGSLYWYYDEEARDIISMPAPIIQKHKTTFTLDDLEKVLPEWDEQRWDRKKLEPTGPSNPTENPWDIRNFAYLLEGYEEQGRIGWHTCMCPSHGTPGSSAKDSLHINVETGAYICHAGCDAKDVKDAAIRIAKEKGYCFPKNRGGNQPLIDLPNYDLTLAPDIVVSEKYIPRDLEVPRDAKVVVLRTPMGSGKTELMARMVARYKEEATMCQFFAHREQLGMQMGQRFNLPYRTDDTRRRYTEGDVRCIDSMRPTAEPAFIPDGDYALGFDEVESTLWQALNSTTNRDRRIEILKTLESTAKAMFDPKNENQIILSDADLSDLSIDFLLELAGKTREQAGIFTLESTWKPAQGWDVYSYDTPASLSHKMLQAIGEGGKHIILTAAQKIDSKWSTQTLEAVIEKQYPDKTILRIDSETISNPNHPAYRFLEMPKEKMHQILASYDVVIASPSIESGCSIELYDHFAAIWCIATGAIPENSVRQFLGRVRDGNVPRHLYAAERGIGNTRIGNGETDPAELLKNQLRNAKESLQFVNPALIQSVLPNGSVDMNFLSISLKYWAKFGARINQGWHRYRDSIEEGLRRAGHNILPPPSKLSRDQAKAFSQAIGAVRDANTDRENIAIASAANLTEPEYNALEQKKEKTTDERQSFLKFGASKKFGVDVEKVTPELIEADRNGSYKLWRTQYFLTVGQQYLHRRETTTLDEMTVEGVAWAPDLNRSLLSRKLAVLYYLGMDEIIETAKVDEIHKNHPLVEQFTKRLQVDPKTIAETLNITISDKNSPVAIIQEILQQNIGFRLEKTGSVRMNGKRTYFYSWPLTVQDCRDEFFGYWLERDQAISEHREGHLVSIADQIKERMPEALKPNKVDTKSHIYNEELDIPEVPASVSTVETEVVEPTKQVKQSKSRKEVKPSNPPETKKPRHRVATLEEMKAKAWIPLDIPQLMGIELGGFAVVTPKLDGYKGGKGPDGKLTKAEAQDILEGLPPTGTVGKVVGFFKSIGSKFVEILIDGISRRILVEHLKPA